MCLRACNSSNRSLETVLFYALLHKQREVSLGFGTAVVHFLATFKHPTPQNWSTLIKSDVRFIYTLVFANMAGWKITIAKLQEPVGYKWWIPQPAMLVYQMYIVKGSASDPKSPELPMHFYCVFLFSWRRGSKFLKYLFMVCVYREWTVASIYSQSHRTTCVFAGLTNYLVFSVSCNLLIRLVQFLCVLFRFWPRARSTTRLQD